MVQPKYNPEEALHRVRLMMGYDLNKTLKENVKETIGIIEEQKSKEEEIASKIFGGAYNGGFGTDEKKILDAILSIETMQQLNNVDNLLKKKSGLGIEQTIGDEFGEEDGAYVQKIANKYKELGFSVESGIQDVLIGNTYKPQFTGGFKVKRSDATKDGKGFDALRAQKNINDIFCSVKNGIITLDGSQNKGKAWSSWTNIYKPTAEQLEKAKNSCGVKDSKSGGASKKSSYTACSGEYKRGCKSDVIRQVQVCLGIAKKYQTGNFGPITQGELAKVGKSFAMGFKDADIKTICNKTPSVTPTQPENNTTGDTAVDDVNSII